MFSVSCAGTLCVTRLYCSTRAHLLKFEAMSYSTFFGHFCIFTIVWLQDWHKDMLQQSCSNCTFIKRFFSVSELQFYMSHRVWDCDSKVTWRKANVQRCGGTFKDEVKVSKSKNEEQWTVHSYLFKVRQLRTPHTPWPWADIKVVWLQVIISQYDWQENGLFVFLQPINSVMPMVSVTTKGSITNFKTIEHVHDVERLDICMYVSCIKLWQQHWLLKNTL